MPHFPKPAEGSWTAHHPPDPLRRTVDTTDAPESMNDATRGVVRRLGRAPAHPPESGFATDEGP